MQKKPLDLYRLMIRSVLASNGDQRIGNESAEHAKVLIEELIRQATGSVDVVCHSLSDDVWGAQSVRDVITSVVRKHSVRFRVVTQLPPSPSAVRFFHSVGATIRCFAKEGWRANFLIVDGRYFRMEPDFAVRCGFAYVNRPAWAAELASAFEKIYAMAV